MGERFLLFYFYIEILINDLYYILDLAVQDLAQDSQCVEGHIITFFQMIQSTFVEIIGIDEFVC